MRLTKTITILILLLGFSISSSAEIKFRSTAPALNPKYKYRVYTPHFNLNTSPNIVTNHSTSYLTNDTHHNKTNRRYYFYGTNQTSYYHKYNPTETTIKNLSFNNLAQIRPSNSNSNQPFNDANDVISTAPSQFAYGPPQEGPIGDILLPFLIFTAIYIIKKQSL